MEPLSAIMNHPAFRRIAACLRPSTVAYRRNYPHLRLATLADEFARASFNEMLIRTNPQAYFAAFDRLAAEVKKIHQRLAIRVDDYQWLTEQIASPRSTVVAAMLAGYTFAREARLVTPAELASVTSDAERTWRERAERGDIPGCVKKGKQWIIPASVVEAMYGVDLSLLPERSEHFRDDEDGELSDSADFTADPDEMIERVQRGDIDLM